MSLSIISVPARISNNALFSVITSLAEDSTHVNLRVRADLYHEGIIKAVIEKPKGLADFDFADILKSLTPGLLFARDSGDIVKTGTIGSELITAWTDKDTTFGTLTTSVNVINSAICTTSSIAQSNTVAMAPGELYLFYASDFATVGANTPRVYLSAGGALEEVMLTNKSILLMPTTSASLRVYLGNQANMQFSGTFHLYKITTNRTTIGSPLAPYFVNFTEVYEDAAGVTQSGATQKSVLCRNVPAIGDSNAFTEYVLHDNICLFASKTLKGNVCKFFSVTPLEYLAVFFTEFVELELFYSKDGGAATHTTHPVCYEGWGAVIVNVGELMATVTATLAFYLKELSAAAVISETLTINLDTIQIDERVVLEYQGLVGGKEYLAFEGLKNLEFDTIRQYYSSSKKMRKPISLTGLCRQKIETRFKDMANAEYLKSLLISEDVKRMEPSYVTPTPVTITTDGVKIDGGREMFTNRLDMEYEY
jgi:hypothetical protein